MNDRNDNTNSRDQHDDFLADLGRAVVKTAAVAVTAAVAGPIGAAIVAIILGNNGDDSSVGDCSC